MRTAATAFWALLVPVIFVCADTTTTWYDIRELGVEGRGFDDTKAYYDRLPARAEGKVRKPVWALSQKSAGMAVRFVTDATTIRARWELTSSTLAMSHMAATGVSGLDLYARDDAGQWRWVAVGKPKGQKNESTLASGIRPGMREYLLYLPLYNGVRDVHIGVHSNSTLRATQAYPDARTKPLVFYGTSITQGACASRPGMCHTAILGRRLGRPVINLGFSGQGRLEPEIATFMAELDAAVFIIDCLPNIQAKEVTERTAPVVTLLREKHPETPILLVEDRNYTSSWLLSSRRERNAASQAALKTEFNKLKAAGVDHLYYLDGKDLLGEDDEATVDSSHPTDLGFFRQADAFETALRAIPTLSEHEHKTE